MWLHSYEQYTLLEKVYINKGVRWWSIITYGKYDESDSKEYSIELEVCQENDLPIILDEFEMGSEVTFEELRDMGWRVIWWGNKGYKQVIVQLTKL